MAAAAGKAMGTSFPSQKHTESLKLLLQRVNRDFPGGPVVASLLCNAGDAGLIPSRGTKIPHATEQLNCVPKLERP